ARLGAQESAGETIGDLLADLEEVHHGAGPRGTFDLEGVTVVQIVLEERSDEDGVHGEPHRPTPVGFAAEHAGIRLRRQIVDTIFLAAYPEDVGVLLVELRDRT